MSSLSERPDPVAMLVMRKFLAFKVADMSYVMDILSVRNVHQGIVPVMIPPDRAHAYFKFEMKLAADTIPVVDLRHGTDLALVAQREAVTIVVIVCHNIEVGLVVSDVTGIVALSEAQLQPLDEINQHLLGEHVVAIRGAGAPLILLSPPLVFADLSASN